MSDLDELVLKIKADTSDANAKLDLLLTNATRKAKESESAMKGLADQFKELIPAITLATMAEFTRRSVEAGAAIAEMAEGTGISVEALSQLEAALRVNNSSLAAFSAGLRSMNRNVSEAMSDPHGNLAFMFQQIGVGLKDLSKADTLQRFLMIADGIAKFGDSADRTRLRLELLGRGGENLGRLMDRGAAGIKAAMDQADRMGLTLSTDKANELKQFNDEFAILVTWAERLAQVQFGGFIQGIQEIAGFAGLGGSDAAQYGSLYQIQGRVVALDAQKRALERRLEALPSSNNELGIADRLMGADVGEARADMERQLEDVNAQIDAFMARYKEIKQAREDIAGGGDHAGLVLHLSKREDDAALDKYIDNLREEADALAVSDRELMIRKAVIEGQNAAMADWKNHLRDTKELLPEETAAIEEATGKLYDMRKAQEQLRRASDQLADGLADLIVNFDNLGDTVTGVLQDIAKEIVKSQITKPFADSISGALGSSFFGGGGLSGIFGSLFGGGSYGGFSANDLGIFGFADGGRPPVGRPSIVGEDGPEIFVPDSAGTVIPNSQGLGGGITVSNTWNIQGGVTRQELAALIPAIEQRSTAATLAAIERGGRAAQIVGKRN